MPRTQLPGHGCVFGCVPKGHSFGHTMPWRGLRATIGLPCAYFRGQPSSSRSRNRLRVGDREQATARPHRGIVRPNLPDIVKSIGQVKKKLIYKGAKDIWRSRRRKEATKQRELRGVADETNVQADDNCRKSAAFSPAAAFGAAWDQVAEVLRSTHKPLGLVFASAYLLTIECQISGEVDLPAWSPLLAGALAGSWFAALNRYGMRRLWKAPRKPLRVVITGGTRGIGKAFAREFLQAGDKVFISGRSQQSVRSAVMELCQELEWAPGGSWISGTDCDVSSPGAVARLASQAKTYLGKVDVWINNAGYSGSFQSFLDISSQQLQEVVQTNLVGGLLCNRAAMKVMAQQQGGGHIFNMDGAGADGFATPNYSAYGATKAGLAHLARSLHHENAAQGTQQRLTTAQAEAEASLGFEDGSRVGVQPAQALAAAAEAVGASCPLEFAARHGECAVAIGAGCSSTAVSLTDVPPPVAGCGGAARPWAVPRGGRQSAAAAEAAVCQSWGCEQGGGSNVGVHTLSPGMVLTELLLEGSTPATRQVFNILCEQPETVAAFLVPRIRSTVARGGSGRYIRYLTPLTALARFLTAPARVGRFFDEHGNRVYLSEDERIRGRKARQTARLVEKGRLRSGSLGLAYSFTMALCFLILVADSHLVHYGVL